MKRFSMIPLACAALALASCSDSNSSVDDVIDLGPGNTTAKADEYYAGGKRGTTTLQNAYAYRQETPAVTEAGMSQAFQIGETLFERDYNTNTTGAFSGLGPVAVRQGCLYCHPAYGHGKRMDRYRANDMGNGYLLVIYDKTNNNYIQSVAGMPQTLAVEPFKAPIDETKIKITWEHATDGWGNKFDDGETYDLTYPEVTIPYSAYYSPVTVKRDGKLVVIPESEYADNIGIRLESTIGIYGTGITDAIPDADITAEWKKQSEYFNSKGETNKLNPAYWDQSTNNWKDNGGYYSNATTGTKYVRRYTYAMSRGPLLDAAGANAIWNITNVNRPDRKGLYLDLNGTIYAKTSMNDASVQAGFPEYINRIDPDKKHPAWHTSDVAQNIYNYLTDKNQDAEMTQDQYKNFMIWHRGLAVPAARNVGTERYENGKRLFKEIGCAACHRPDWNTGDDNIQDPNGLFGNNDMPRYPKQHIWPYSDFVQHRLFMKNDIRTGWCRTTPLWGRGLSKLCTGAEDRLHDCRAKNTLEAIMWHGYSPQSDAYECIKKFRALTKEQRNDIIFFVESI